MRQVRITCKVERFPGGNELRLIVGISYNATTHIYDHDRALGVRTGDVVGRDSAIDSF
jgi:hypothetical protein